MAFAVDDARAVEVRDARDGGAGGGLRGVEVDDGGGGAFEGEDDGVGREDGERGVEFLSIVPDQRMLLLSVLLLLLSSMDAPT